MNCSKTVLMLILTTVYFCLPALAKEPASLVLSSELSDVQTETDNTSALEKRDPSTYFNDAPAKLPETGKTTPTVKETENTSIAAGESKPPTANAVESAKTVPHTATESKALSTSADPKIVPPLSSPQAADKIVPVAGKQAVAAEEKQLPMAPVPQADLKTAVPPITAVRGSAPQPVALPSVQVQTIPVKTVSDAVIPVTDPKTAPLPPATDSLKTTILPPAADSKTPPSPAPQVTPAIQTADLPAVPHNNSEAALPLPVKPLTQVPKVESLPAKTGNAGQLPVSLPPATNLAAPEKLSQDKAVTSSLPSKADTVKMESQRLAKAMMETFRTDCAPLAEVKKESGMFGMFSSEDNPVLSKCLEDLNVYANTFWSLPDTAEALHLTASLRKAKKDAPDETVALSRLLYVYKDSPWSTAASSRLMGLALEELKGERQTLKLLAKGSALAEPSDRYFQFIQDLAKIESGNFLNLLRLQCDDFLQRFPGHSGAETVLSLREESFNREKQFELAAAGYRKIIAVYPESPQRPARLLTLGTIYAEQLKKYEQAASTFETIFSSYPDNPESLTAYQAAARIYDEKLEKPANAVALLDRIVNRYPKEEAALQALEYEARIYNLKIRNYYSAIKAYQRLADMFKGDDAANALIKAAELARSPIEDYELQVEIQNRLVTEYPNRPESIQALYDSAETYLEKLRNHTKAVASFQQLIDNYPSSKQAEKARAVIAKINSRK